MRVAAGLLLLAVGSASPGAVAEPGPQEDYLLHCSGCHRMDGGGTPGTVPPLLGLAPIYGAPGGRAYLARVPGVAQAPLSDARLARLLNWTLLTFGAAPDAGYDAAEIAALRRVPLRDTRAARARLVPAPSEPAR